MGENEKGKRGGSMTFVNDINVMGRGGNIIPALESGNRWACQVYTTLDLNFGGKNDQN